MSIIDVQGGHQPMTNEDHTVWAALNGEIYRWLAISGRIARVAPAPLRVAGVRTLRASPLRGRARRLAAVLGAGHIVERHVSGRADHSRVLSSVLAFGSWLDGQRGTCAL